MNRDDIINLAFEHTVGGLEFNEEGLLRFVQIIDAAARAAEREECAKVAEDADHLVDVPSYHAQLGDAQATARNIAAAIRARGQT